MSNLIRIVPWSHRLLHEVLCPGDTAVDLTAGQGQDTLMLAQAVGPSGRVVAFDVQEEALRRAAANLAAAGLSAARLPAGETLPTSPGIYLTQACHASLPAVVASPVRGVIANLGYFPGGDPVLITNPATTCRALRSALDLLLAGGRLTVAVYPGHPGGAAEAAAVDHLFAGLPRDQWHVLRLAVANVARSPYLLVAEKTGKTATGP